MKQKEKHKYIYKITNSVNGKIYIGKTIKSIDTRFKEHIRTSQKINKTGALKCTSRLYLAMIKYGCENFYVELVEELGENDDLNEREKYWIAYYDSTNDSIGYNIAKGGDGGDLFKDHKHSKETKEKFSNDRKGLHWYTNGFKDVMCFSCPDGYWEGRTNIDVSGSKNWNWKGKLYMNPEILCKKVQNLKNGEIFNSVKSAISVYGLRVKQSLKYNRDILGVSFAYVINDVPLNDVDRQKLYEEYLNRSLNYQKNKSIEREVKKFNILKKRVDDILLQHNLSSYEYISIWNSHLNKCPLKYLKQQYNISTYEAHTLNDFYGLERSNSSKWASWLKKQN